jgi:hypothetical protein
MAWEWRHSIHSQMRREKSIDLAVDNPFLFGFGYSEWNGVAN